MSTTEGSGPRSRTGIQVEFPGVRPHWNKEVQRAEGDGTGSPVGGTETVLTKTPGNQTRFVDRGKYSALDGSKAYIYRFRWVRPGAQDGAWSDWTREQDLSVSGGQETAIAPNVEIQSIDIDSSGLAGVTVKGNEGAADVYVAARIGGAPQDPEDGDTIGQNLARVAGRIGRVPVTGPGSDIDNLEFGETIFVKAQAATVLNDNSTIQGPVAEAQKDREHDEAPAFGNVGLEKVVDDSTNDTYHINWTISGGLSQLSNPVVAAVFYRNGSKVDTVHYETTDTPATQAISGADGAVDTHQVIFKLQDGIGVAANVQEQTETDEVESEVSGSSGPSGLSVSFDPSDCDMDLAWTADSGNSQDIYRCSGAECDPQTDGSKIADVAAGTATHTDDVSGVAQGTTLRYQVTSTAGDSNTDGDFRGICPS